MEKKFGPFNYDCINSSQQTGILSADFLNLVEFGEPKRFHKKGNIPSPYLVLRGVHRIAEGLISDKPRPSENDLKFLSGAYGHFYDLGGPRRNIFGKVKKEDVVSSPDNLRREGRALLLAEDTLVISAVLDQCLSREQKLHTKIIDIGRPIHRKRAGELLDEAGDREGFAINTVQQILSDRIGGTFKFFTVGRLLTETLFQASSNESVLCGTGYKAPSVMLLASADKARVMFMENVLAHQADPLVRNGC